MTKAKIEAGNCGFLTEVEAISKENYIIELSIQSECKHIQKMANTISEVNALDEISFRKGMPEILQRGAEYCTHAACPVPVGIIKAVEVAAGFTLPQEAKISIEK